MMGMDEITGLMVSGNEYATQCVRRFMKTNKRSLIMFRELGPDIVPYLAKSMTDVWMLSLTGEFIDSAESLLPEIEIQFISFSQENGLLRSIVSVEWNDSVFSVDAAL